MTKIKVSAGQFVSEGPRKVSVSLPFLASKSLLHTTADGLFPPSLVPIMVVQVLLTSHLCDLSSIITSLSNHSKEQFSTFKNSCD